MVDKEKWQRDAETLPVEVAQMLNTMKEMADSFIVSKSTVRLDFTVSFEEAKEIFSLITKLRSEQK
jgi:hypothetical protein